LLWFSSIYCGGSFSFPLGIRVLIQYQFPMDIMVLSWSAAGDFCKSVSGVEGEGWLLSFVSLDLDLSRQLDCRYGCASLVIFACRLFFADVTDADHDLYGLGVSFAE